MSDGKRSTKQDIVIVSIKPRRPEYPLNKTHVLVKELHLEWDKLDAYYRGQLLKLKTQSTKSKTTRSRKSSKSSRSSSKKSSSISRRSRAASGNQLTELFGDENIPLSDNDQDLEISDEDEENLILSNKRDIRKDRSRKKLCKLDGPKQDPDDKNYLSIPRDNFRIEFAISLKTRTPLHDQSDNSGTISPIKVQPYKPPIAIGFNGVHIQKILYHKTEGVNHTSPTTTALTPDKPQDNESASPLFIRSESKTEKSSDNSNSTATTVFRNNTNSTSSENKVNKLANKNKSSSPPAPIKRKLQQLDNGPVSSTTTASEDSLETQPKKRKDKIIKDKVPLTLSPAQDKLVRSQCSTTKSLSITDKIIKKAKQLPPEMKERERQRLLESQKRKTYASTIGDEQQVMDSVDAALKAFEMIWTGRPLSPIRSP